MTTIRWLKPEDPPDALPDPSRALKDPNGLLAVGGSLSPDWLLHCYARGIFPWYEDGQPILSSGRIVVRLREGISIAERDAMFATYRVDLVNAWLKKAPATETHDALDIVGRLLATTAQLDMYMTSEEVMNWYLRQFIAGNGLIHNRAHTRCDHQLHETLQSQ